MRRSPHPRNVRHFELAAAAEAAGYRACLRCRPYRIDQPVSWEKPELVCRGIHLILDGALDRGSESELASRLNISPRHLRRVFLHHLGVTPDQLARSRRSHFARRLLDDTDLSIAEIAFAAGFGSFRQLNRAIREVFRATPSELRARRRSKDRLVADGGLTLRLSFQPPLDWDTMLSYFSARTIKGVEQVQDGIYRRTILVDGDPGVIEIAPGGPDYLLLNAHLPHWEGLIHIAQQARRIFNLDLDQQAAVNHLGSDPLIGELVQARPGLRMPGCWDAYEIGVRAIIGQQISVSGAGTIIARLVEKYGTPVPGLAQMGLSHFFPSAQTLVEADLTQLGLTKARKTAIQIFARAVAAGSLHLDRGSSLDELVSSLVTLPGIGLWTAHYIALRLGEPNAFPATDLGLRKALEQLVGTHISASEVIECATSWQPWRSQATINLWGLH